MDIDRKQYDKAGESLYTYDHSSGLKAFVIPKKGYTKNMLPLLPTMVQ